MNDNESQLFNEIYKEICDEIGFESAIAIYHLYRGQQITFPVHLYNAKLVKSKIIEEYDGNNIRQLSKKYDYSEKTVRRMIKESFQA